ncbi:chorion class CB protein M5H4-like [Anticarsia gemmatalis]|uniref:chorion class CB protein M5H4-like n=1 Tax=Anticarsia gemmatalis TaxID=129554 RepID=UPI003F75C933
MWVKGLFIICIQATLLKAVLSQCIRQPVPPSEGLLPSNMAYEGLAPIAPVTRIIGANLIVDTSAPEPSGVSIFSDNLYIEGNVLVTGSLPFLGTVALEGIVPALGNSAVAYECGTGDIGMVSDVPNYELGLGLADVSRISRL